MYVLWMHICMCVSVIICTDALVYMYTHVPVPVEDIY